MSIATFCKTNTVSMVVLGPAKSGKTTLCLEAIQGHDHLVLEYEQLDSHADLVKRISNFISTPRRISVLEAMKGGVGSAPRIIFLDDVDILFSQDRFANGYILDWIKKAPPSIKFLITCTACQERKVTELKKKSEVVRLPPSVQAQDQDQAQAQAQDPSQTYFDKNIYDVVEHLFKSDTCTLKDTELGIGTDPTLISFMMYDNFKAHLAERFSIPIPIDKIYAAYVAAAELEDVVFGSADATIAEIPALLRCHTIRLVQAQAQAQEKTGQNPKKGPAKAIAYTQITSRSAQHYNVMKRHAAVGELTPANIAMLAQLPGSKPDLKTDVGIVCQAFAYNILQGGRTRRAGRMA